MPSLRLSTKDVFLFLSSFYQSITPRQFFQVAQNMGFLKGQAYNLVYDPEQSYRTAERLTDIASRVKQEEGKKLGLKEMRKLVPTTRWKILRYLYESKGDAQKAREQYYKPKPQTMLEYHPHFRRPEQPEDPSLDGKIKDSEEHRAWD